MTKTSDQGGRRRVAATRLSFGVVAFDVGPLGRRRASEPRPEGSRAACLSPSGVVCRRRVSRSAHPCAPAALVRPCTAGARRSGREAEEAFGGPGCVFFWLHFIFAQAKKSNTPAVRKPHHSGSRYRPEGDTTPLTPTLSRRERE